MSRRTERLGTLLQQEISQILSNLLHDPRLGALLTVTGVSVTPSLDHAIVSISVIGDKVQAKESMEGLESANGFIHRELKGRLRIKQVPRIRFLLDTSLEAGQRMLTLLDQVKEIEANQSDESLGN